MLIAINIKVSNNIINDFPIIFYWDDIDKDNVIDDIELDESFRKYLTKQNIFSSDNYCSSKINYIKINNDDKYKETKIDIQDIYLLRILDIKLTYDILHNQLVNLYKIIFKEDFNNEELVIDDEELVIDDIINIYTKIKITHKDKFSDLSFINYIRHELQKQLNKYNVNFVIDTLKNIINFHND